MNYLQNVILTSGQKGNFAKPYFACDWDLNTQFSAFEHVNVDQHKSTEIWGLLSMF